MANDGIVLLLVFLKEVLSTRKGHLIDISLHFIRCHPNSVVGNSESLCLSINMNVDGAVITLSTIPRHRSHTSLTDGIDTVTH